MLVEVRYNSNHKNGDRLWKVFIDKQLLKVDSIEFLCQINSSIGHTDDGRETGHVTCDARKITLEDYCLVIE
jgi:hypothetical protein